MRDAALFGGRFVGRESIRVDVFGYRIVPGRRLQVLSDRHAPHAGRRQVVEGAEHFVPGFAEADHHGAFGQIRLVVAVAMVGDVPQYVQRGRVGCPPVPDGGGQPFDGFEIVAHDVGAGLQNGVQQGGIAAKVGDKQFDGGFGIEFPDRPDGRRPVGGPAVREVVAVHRGNDGVP